MRVDIMVSKAHGPRRRTRKKFSNPKKMTITRLLGNFENGQTVAIVISSNSQRGQPFKRFHGLTGTVIGKRGRSFIVEFKDQQKKKQIIAGPEHLKKLST
jgi:large subunit ribosomal protein L21e